MDTNKYIYVYFSYYLYQIVKTHHPMNQRHEFDIKTWIKENEKSIFISKSFKIIKDSKIR